MISKYQFPRDLSEEFKKIYFLAYETLNRDFGSMETSTAEKKNAGLLNTTDTVSNLKAIITLPMPETFGDDLVHTWEKKDTLESLDAGASSATDAMIGVAALSSIFKSIQGIAAPLIGTLSLSKVVTGFLNAGKSPSVGLMSMFSGARKTLVNPDYWQNYTGSDPRTFEFKYVFQPRSREEATEVLNILRVFKMLSSPRLENVAESGSFSNSIESIFFGDDKNNNSTSTGSEEIKPIGKEDATKQIGGFGENLKKGVCNIEFDKKNIPINKMIVTTLDSKFYLYDFTNYFQNQKKLYDEVNTTIWGAKFLPQKRDMFVSLGGDGNLNLYKYDKKDFLNNSNDKLNMLSSNYICSRPIIGFDWHLIKNGLACLVSLDNSIKICKYDFSN